MTTKFDKLFACRALVRRSCLTVGVFIYFCDCNQLLPRLLIPAMLLLLLLLLMLMLSFFCEMTISDKMGDWLFLALYMRVVGDCFCRCLPPLADCLVVMVVVPQPRPPLSGWWFSST